MNRRRSQQQASLPVRRCAIYTRKSTSHGLDQAFSSLDAQREACAAYVRNRAHEGWVLLEQTYEDGGFTGANTNRPGFQRLLDDVDRGLVDIILVYKVDRLSRSLMDFARFMERLNQNDCAFVSVTQNFSTADAMGWLTLNMLMSFAEMRHSFAVPSFGRAPWVLAPRFLAPLESRRRAGDDLGACNRGRLPAAADRRAVVAGREARCGQDCGLAL